MEYIFFETDASFSYQGPFGTAIQEEKELHGFEVEITNDNVIKLETLKGFGAFSYEASKVKTLEELFELIENNKGYVSENPDEESKYTRLELLLELQQIIIQNLKDKVSRGYTPECPIYSGLKWQAA